MYQRQRSRHFSFSAFFLGNQHFRNGCCKGITRMELLVRNTTDFIINFYIFIFLPKVSSKQTNRLLHIFLDFKIIVFFFLNTLATKCVTLGSLFALMVSDIVIGVREIVYAKHCKPSLSVVGRMPSPIHWV